VGAIILIPFDKYNPYLPAGRVKQDHHPCPDRFTGMMKGSPERGCHSLLGFCSRQVGGEGNSPSVSIYLFTHWFLYEKNGNFIIYFSDR